MSAVQQLSAGLGQRVAVAMDEYLPRQVAALSESVKLVRKLTALTVSSIVYLRTNLPENYFNEIQLGKLKLKMLNEKRAGVRPLCDWIRGAADAIRLGYLKKLTIAVFEDREHPENARELYSLIYDYTESGEPHISADCNDSNVTRLVGIGSTVIPESQDPHEKLRYCSKQMLKWTLMATQALEPFSTTPFLTMRLEYTEKTPADYEPRGFGPCEGTSFDLEANEPKISPEVRTPWHGFHTEVRTKVNEDTN